MINKSDADFKEGMKQARKELHYEANSNVVTTLFSTKKGFTKDNSVDDVINLSDKLSKLDNKPQQSTITIMLGKGEINTKSLSTMTINQLSMVFIESKPMTINLLIIYKAITFT